MVGRVSVKYCSTRPISVFWPIRIRFCPTSGGGPHRPQYTVDCSWERPNKAMPLAMVTHTPRGRDHERTTTTSSALCMYENSHGWPTLLRLPGCRDRSRRTATADFGTRRAVLPHRCPTKWLSLSVRGRPCCDGLLRPARRRSNAEQRAYQGKLGCCCIHIYCGFCPRRSNHS